MKERAESRKMRMMRFPVEKLRWSSCQTISFPWQTWCQGRLLCKQMSSNDECMQKQISPKERWSSWKWKLIIMKNQKLKGCIAVHAGMLMIMMTVHSRSSLLVWNADSIGIVDFIHYFPFFSSGHRQVPRFKTYPVLDSVQNIFSSEKYKNGNDDWVFWAVMQSNVEA